ncbi:Molybdenum cofactor biosynthesis protein B [Phycisphaerae bacterium RAS2]|nr:Molybdenum cofactor biosynthesis protein B [Phycisphaerae bacterium RAS2]
MFKAAVVTISDSRSAGSKEDRSGPAAAELVAALGVEVVERRMTADEADQIADCVRSLVGRVNLIVTTGGTGIGPRDVTPEAIVPMLDRELPGFGEIMRTGGYSKTPMFDRTPLSIMTRGGAGIIGHTLVVMLPGSVNGVRSGLDLIGPAIRHALGILNRTVTDCSATAQGHE